MITVGAPTTIEPPWVVVSPMRAAGRLPIITFAEPIAMASGGPVHTHMSPTTAAGMPLISTVGTPGPVIGPPTCGIGGGARGGGGAHRGGARRGERTHVHVSEARGGRHGRDCPGFRGWLQPCRRRRTSARR